MHRAIVPDDLAAVIIVFLVLRHVGNQHDGAQQARASGRPILRSSSSGMAPQQFRKFRRAPGLRHELEDAVPVEGDHAVGRIAEFDRGPGQAVEHRVQIERRAADDLQHLSGRGLLLQRLAQVAVLAFTSSNSRAFSMAIAA